MLGILLKYSMKLFKEYYEHFIIHDDKFVLQDEHFLNMQRTF